MAHRIELECVSCALCAEICPEKCIVEDVEAFVIDGEACTDCGDCVPVCPVDCIIGQKVSESPATIEACLLPGDPLPSQDQEQVQHQEEDWSGVRNRRG